MLYLSGVIRPDMPAMVTPRMGQQPPEGQKWAADNGRYASPQDYTDEGYLTWLARMPVERCLFATAPDVVGDAVSTLLMSAPMYARIQGLGYPVALVAQDGLERISEMIPWYDIDCLFIGGTTDWKLSPAVAGLVRMAKDRGKWVHMGRVNSRQRVMAAAAIGCDSVDGTMLRFDPKRPVQRWAREAASLVGLGLD